MEVLQEYKCPCCGGAVSFDSGLQKMKCPYCDKEFEIDALKAMDETKAADADDEMHWNNKESGAEWNGAEAEGMRVYICNSCGGEIVCDETTAATSCPYCDNPVVVRGNVSGMLRPELVIPFKLDKKAAIEALSNHLKGKKILPKIFRKKNHIEEVKGIYVPFWLFSADVDADIRYKGTKVRYWSDSNYNYTETKHYSIYRSGSVGFKNIPVDGSSKMADDLMDSIEPFDLSEGVDFNTAYLAGYFADKYDVDAEQSIERANSRIKRSAEDVLRNTVSGYNTVSTDSSSVKLYNGSSRYALLPVWILNTTWKNKKFTFAMNGQTGKFVGNLPVDRGAFWKYWAIWAVIISAVTYVIQLLLGC